MGAERGSTDASKISSDMESDPIEEFPLVVRAWLTFQSSVSGCVGCTICKSRLRNGRGIEGFSHAPLQYSMLLMWS